MITVTDELKKAIRTLFKVRPKPLKPELREHVPEAVRDYKEALDKFYNRKVSQNEWDHVETMLSYSIDLEVRNKLSINEIRVVFDQTIETYQELASASMGFFPATEIPILYKRFLVILMYAKC